MFVLDVLKARHGDCMFLHVGTESQPQHILIDGGPSKVYKTYLRPYMEQVAADRGLDVLPIRLLLISHIDDDHIRGILDMTRDLRQRDDDGEPLPFSIQTLWHNSFDDILGNTPQALLQMADQAITLASNAGTLADSGLFSHDSTLMLASVPQGRKLRQDAAALGWEVNQPGGGHIVASRDNPFLWTNEGGDLTFQVVGPSLERMRKLQEKWDKELEKRNLGIQPDPVETAAFVDRSVYNLASLVIMASSGSRRMLLTGDARGDHILEGLADAKLLDDQGRIHVDLLKMPHHGSDRNVAPEFFEAVTADKYVMSGDGKHGNPEPATFQMIFDSRKPGEWFEIYLTYAIDDLIHHYPVDELKRMIQTARDAGKTFEIISLPEDDSFHRIDLSS